MRPKYRRIEANQSQPIVEQSRILPCAQVRSYGLARKKEPVSDARQRSQMRVNGQFGLLGDLELHGPAGLSLPHGGPLDCVAVWCHIIDLKADDVTASELDVDRQVEQRQISGIRHQLQVRPDRLDMLGL